MGNYQSAAGRITKFKWLTSLLWAGIVYMLVKLFELTLAGDQTNAQHIADFLLYAGIPLAVIAFLVFSYDAFIQKMQRSAHFAFDEIEFQIHSAETEKGKA